MRTRILGRTGLEVSELAMGETLEEALANIREAIELYLELTETP